MSVGVAEAEVDVLVFVDITELDVLLGTVVPKAAHAVPKTEGFLKSSANVPLATPNFAPEAEPMVTLPL